MSIPSIIKNNRTRVAGVPENQTMQLLPLKGFKDQGAAHTNPRYAGLLIMVAPPTIDGKVGATSVCLKQE